jgi:DNA primase
MRAQAWPPFEADDRARLFLQSRGLEPAVRMGLVGLLDDSRSLPEEVSWWPGTEFRVLSPLFDFQGRLVTIQARRICAGEPKVVFPKRSRPKGAAFANHPGRRLLSGDANQAGVVVFGEGLTDSLALSICLDGPVLCAPGVDFCVPAIGPWVRGRAVALALDNDDAGDGAVAAVTDRALELGAASVWRVQWPFGLKDACDVLAAEGPEEVARCVLNAPGGSDDR